MIGLVVYLIAVCYHAASTDTAISLVGASIMVSSVFILYARFTLKKRNWKKEDQVRDTQLANNTEPR